MAFARWRKPSRNHPRGGWQGLYNDLNGKRRSVGIWPPNMKRKALEKARDQEAAIRRGDWIDPDGPRTKLRDWVQIWESERVVRPSTADNTRRRLQHHILPEFGDMPIGRIRRGQVQQWVNTMAQRGVARESIKSYLSLLSTIMNAAIEGPQDPLILQNPCRKIAIPETVNEGRQPVALTAEQAGRLLAAMPPRDRILVLYPMGTGLRWGEVVGTLEEYIDLDAATAWYPEQLSEVNGTRERGPTKTRASKRRVNLPPTVVAALRDHLTTTKRHPEGYVFTTVRGMTLARGNWRERVWADAVDDAGCWPARTTWRNPHTDREDVPANYHDLRRTFASCLENNGMGRRVVEVLLGHASDGNVTDRYALVADETRTKATAVVEAFLLDVLEAEAKVRDDVVTRREQRLAAEREAARGRRAERKAKTAPAGRKDRKSAA